jgi:hypothetical protein
MESMPRIRAVIDSDTLEDRSLVSFLEASALNQAVIPDIVGMEAYLGDASVKLRSKFGPIVRYADRSLLLIIFEIIQL